MIFIISNKEKCTHDDHDHSHDAREHHEHKETIDIVSLDNEHEHVHEHKDGGIGEYLIKLCSFSSCNIDLNFRAVILHYFGDALSSLCLLFAGILLHFFPVNIQKNENLWTLYIDPVSRFVNSLYFHVFT